MKNKYPKDIDEAVAITRREKVIVRDWKKSWLLYAFGSFLLILSAIGHLWLAKSLHNLFWFVSVSGGACFGAMLLYVTDRRLWVEKPPIS